jgi:AmiR/NasT family two-component response regulator
MPGSGSIDTHRGLRMLVADEDRAILGELGAALEALGHEVAAIAATPEEACAVVAREDPDVALVGVREPDQEVLDLIGEVAQVATGPVIALLEDEDPELVAAAAECGIFAYVRPIAQETLQSAIEVAIRRHAETEQLAERVDQLESALERRALIERAKGILMERHDLDDDAAFELLRRHARATSAKVVAVARAVTEGAALPAPGEPAPSPSG